MPEKCPLLLRGISLAVDLGEYGGFEGVEGGEGDGKQRGGEVDEEGCGNGGRWDRGLGGEVEVNVAEDIGGGPVGGGGGR